MKYSPVYVDGPLLGERFDADEPLVQAVEHLPDQDAQAMMNAGRVVTYQLRKVAFRMGSKVVAVWVGWCGEDEPDAETVCRALFRDEVMERAEVAEMPADPTLARLS